MLFPGPQTHTFDVYGALLPSPARRVHMEQKNFFSRFWRENPLSGNRSNNNWYGGVLVPTVCVCVCVCGVCVWCVCVAKVMFCKDVKAAHYYWSLQSVRVFCLQHGLPPMVRPLPSPHGL